MKPVEIKHPQRVIDELLRFIRKVMNEPEICEKAKEIARRHSGKANAAQLIAEELSATTNVNIPIEHSDADRLFLEVLQELVKDEKALY
ncbi:hypothetical protein [Marinobacterium lutimaris]|uniref:Uncharacterized protein n=1 Tax=Marinobacterium lutimaris TaxID=568106 RepID=A0A1H6DRE0_9GAMM|nr:hypothetical protein [Marinobacterium lutimaris]SEG87286.1 hypothetical protein SAMN05444390_10861 [Marinobacterium lutimaris]